MMKELEKNLKSKVSSRKIALGVSFLSGGIIPIELCPPFKSFELSKGAGRNRKSYSREENRIYLPKLPPGGWSGGTFTLLPSGFLFFLPFLYLRYTLRRVSLLFFLIVI